MRRTWHVNLSFDNVSLDENRRIEGSDPNYGVLILILDTLGKSCTSHFKLNLIYCCTFSSRPIQIGFEAGVNVTLDQLDGGCIIRAKPIRRPPLCHGNK